LIINKLDIFRGKNDESSYMDAIYTKDSKQLMANTRALIRQIQVCCTTFLPILDGADPRVDILVVYTSIIPENYQLPGISKPKIEMHTSGIERDHFWLGIVSTPFHSMKMEHRTLEGDSDYFDYIYKKF
jgi:hypothetical protein